MSAKPQRKMVEIDVVETSAVDHPAHLREGWLVKKSATQEDIDALFGDINKKKDVEPVAEDATKGPTQEEFDALVAKNAALEVERNEAVAKAAEAEAKVEKAAAPADSKEELLKAVPQEVRDMIAKAEQAAADAQEQIAKERDSRLDTEAVAISKATYKSLAFDHSTVAPALRRVALIDENLAKSVTEVLKAAEGQLQTAGVFSEFGKSSADAGESSLDKAVAAVKAANPGMGEAEAVTKAVEADPSLYLAYLEGK